jgi:hypothetical protein
MRAVIIWQGHFHMNIHIIWRLWNTLDVFDIDMEAILNGSIASTTSLWCDLTLRRYQEFKGSLQQNSLANGSSCSVDKIQRPMHIHNIWKLWYPLDLFYIVEEAILNVSIASTTALCCGLPPWDYWIQGKTSKAWTVCTALMVVLIIHMHIHSIWMLWNTLDVFDIDVEAIWMGLPYRLGNKNHRGMGHKNHSLK